MPLRSKAHPRWLVWVALLVLFHALVALPLRAQDEEQTISLGDYRVEVQRAIALLEDANADNEGETIDRLQEHFATITRVEYENGDVVVIHTVLGDLDPASDDLERDEIALAPRAVALARLRGVAAQIDATGTDDTQNRLMLLSSILARPEFRTPMTLWDRFWRWFDNWLSEILPDRRAGNGGAWLAPLVELIPWIVTIAVVAAVLWLLSYWLQRILRSFVTDARRSEIAEDGDMPATAAEARQQARTAAQSGNYRDAVRRLYLAALLQLAEHDLITYERSLTNREVLVRVPQDSPIRPHLEPVVTTFDQVWYGIREPDQATFHAYEQEIDELAAVARRTPPASPGAPLVTVPAQAPRPRASNRGAP